MSVKSVVLLSGGLDSSVNLYEAHRHGEVVLALTFNYGQRAALAEIRSASKLCEILSIRHQTIELFWLGALGGSALTDSNKTLPLADEIQINDQAQSIKSAKAVWVPNRNGVFLNIAAAMAESMGADQVVPGFNIEEAQTFADNSQEFLTATTRAFSFSTANQVKAHCYTTELDKKQLVLRGDQLNLAFESLWPCYQNGKNWCGECESCLRFKNAGGFDRISG